MPTAQAFASWPSTEDACKAVGVQALPPVHPESGESFVEAAIDARTDRKTQRYAPPLPPSRWTCDYVDDDGEEVGTRELTEAEYVEAVARYEKALERWNKTGGIVQSQGPTTIEATCRTPSGMRARFLWSQRTREWHLVESWCAP